MSHIRKYSFRLDVKLSVLENMVVYQLYGKGAGVDLVHGGDTLVAINDPRVSDLGVRIVCRDDVPSEYVCSGYIHKAPKPGMTFPYQ